MRNSKSLIIGIMLLIGATSFVQAGPKTTIEPAEIAVGAPWNQRALTVTHSEGGTTMPGSNDVIPGGFRPIEITAIPDSGYEFVKWIVVSGDVVVMDPQSKKTTVILPENAVVKAMFKESTALPQILCKYSNVGVTEGRWKFLMVKLSEEPISPITATVSISGDPDLTLYGKKLVVFHSGNWNRWQDIRVRATGDADKTQGEAIVKLTSEDAEGVSLRVHEIELPTKIAAKEWKVNAHNPNKNIEIFGVVASNDTLVKINPATGETTIVGFLGIDVGCSSLTFWNDRLIGCSFLSPKMVYENNRRDWRRQVAVYEINTETGKATILKTFTPPTSLGNGAGVELVPNENAFYWSTNRALNKLDIGTGAVTKVMDLRPGTVCLTRHSRGYIVAINGQKQMINIHPESKKVITRAKLALDAGVPSITMTPTNSIYMVTGRGSFYYMSNPNAKPVRLGKTGLVPWGIACRKVGMKPGTRIPAKEWKANNSSKDVELFGLVAANNSLVKIDPSTGETTIVGNLGIKVSMSSLAFWGDRLIGCSFVAPTATYTNGRRILTRQVCVYEVNKETGKATVLKKFTVNGMGSGAGVELVPNENALYWSNNCGICKLDLTTGKVSKVMNMRPGTYCLASHSNGYLVGVTIGANELVNIHPKSGKITKQTKLQLDASVPSITMTPTNEIFMVTFSGSFYHMKNANAKPVRLGKTGLVPWGIACRKINNKRVK